MCVLIRTLTNFSQQIYVNIQVILFTVLAFLQLILKIWLKRRTFSKYTFWGCLVWVYSLALTNSNLIKLSFIHTIGYYPGFYSFLSKILRKWGTFIDCIQNCRFCLRLGVKYWEWWGISLFYKRNIWEFV